MQPKLTTHDPAPVAASLRACITSLLALGKARQVGLLALVVLGSFVEGLGILLLIPLSGVMTVLMFTHRIPADFRHDRILRLADGQVQE